MIKLYLVGDIESENKNQWDLVTDCLATASNYVLDHKGCIVKTLEVKQYGK